MVTILRWGILSFIAKLTTTCVLGRAEPLNMTILCMYQWIDNNILNSKHMLLLYLKYVFDCFHFFQIGFDLCQISNNVHSTTFIRVNIFWLFFKDITLFDGSKTEILKNLIHKWRKKDCCKNYIENKKSG